MTTNTGAPPPARREVLLGRVARVRGALAEKGVARAFFTSPESIYYLAGYQTRAIAANQCLILGLAGEIVLVTRHIDRGNFAAIADASPVDRLRPHTDG